jgi:hypothetical protein
MRQEVESEGKALVNRRICPSEVQAFFLLERSRTQERPGLALIWNLKRVRSWKFVEQNVSA